MTEKEVLHHSRVLWDYHTMPSKVLAADFILALGSHDTRAAYHAATVFNQGMAQFIVCSGGYGKVTKESWNETEGAHYARIIRGLGVDQSKILIEDKSTNTGDNFSFTKELFAKNGIDAKTGIIVTKPYMSRRAFATGSKQWPEIEWQVSSPPIAFEDYPNEEVSLERTINLMVGDLQRIAVYPSKGFQVEQDIPKEVWESYEWLKSAGFDQFVMR